MTAAEGTVPDPARPNAVIAPYWTDRDGGAPGGQVVTVARSPVLARPIPVTTPVTVTRRPVARGATWDTSGRRPGSPGRVRDSVGA